MPAGSVTKIEFRQVGKSFGRTQALQDVSFVVHAGTVHGIVGENGAGKSTAMKLLCGMYRPDHGEIFVNGVRADFSSAVDASRAGIGIVHQHFMLAPPFSALENLILFRPGGLGQGWFRRMLSYILPIDSRNLGHEYQKLAVSIGIKADLSQHVEQMTVVEQQKLELLKVLSQDAEIIIFDEPTAVLPPQEVEQFFAHISSLKAQGKTILLITHKLHEIKSITDEVTVFRHGRTVGRFATSAKSKAQIANLMVGDNTIPATVANPLPSSPSQVLHLSAVSWRCDDSALDSLDLSLGTGEIVGVAGVEGNGQTALLNALLNPKGIHGLSGEIIAGGQRVNNLSAKEIRNLGVIALPEDRIRFGVIPGLSLCESFLVGQHRSRDYQAFGFYDFRNIRRSCRALLDRFDVRPRDITTPLDALSGGNQQKFVVGRALKLDPKILIAAHPTRGVDILAKAQIHNELIAQSQKGTGILVLSSDLEELFVLCHRIVVLYKGAVIKEFDAGNYDLRAIGLAMGGVL